MPRARRIVVTCLAAVSVALVHADDEGLTLTPGREVTFETSEGTWLSLDVSPDGAEIAFELLGDIYRLPIDGGRAEPVTSGMAFDSQPRFSPDGEHIAFISDRDGQEDVWIMGRDGSDAKRLSEGGKMVELASPSFAPDGSHVIVSRTTWGLGTFELWAYHTDGGKGVQITKAKATPDTPRSQRSNALGAVYSPDGRYLYYAGKLGGFGYNVMLPQWQIVRRDLRSGDEDMLTQAQGSGMRPLLSPDGRWLVYGARHDQHTGLRRRNLETGVDEWLIYPVEHDDQESRFTRDLLPGYAFTPDGSALIYAVNGTIHRYEFADGSSHEIPFTAKVEQSLGPRLYFPYRLGLGPVKARMLMGPELSPDGLKLAFSAFLELYVRDLTSGDSRVVSPDGVSAFHPTWSPDGRQLAYVSWSSEGGHVWRTRADGRGRPRQVSTTPGFYSDPVWSPDGKRIVALRASSYDRLYREADFGAPIGSDVVWFPADGGAANLVVPSRGFQGPHFGPESDRIYLSGNTGLISLRYDGTDRRAHLAVKGPGVYMAEEEVPAADIRISPDGRRALVLHANQLYLVEVLNPNLTGLEVSLANPSLPVARLTDVGADFFGWADQGTEIYWTVGHQLYRRPVESVVFRDDEEANGDSTEGDQNGAAAEDEPTTEAAQDAAIAEMDEAVQSDSVDVYRPRHRPEGTLVL
ncbi:MAG: amidohydrolase, partial [Gammaproteobacteria bacterium]